LFECYHKIELKIKKKKLSQFIIVEKMIKQYIWKNIKNKVNTITNYDYIYIKCKTFFFDIDIVIQSIILSSYFDFFPKRYTIFSLVYQMDRINCDLK